MSKYLIGLEKKALYGEVRYQKLLTYKYLTPDQSKELNRLHWELNMLWKEISRVARP